MLWALLLGYWIDTKSDDLWLVDFDRFRKTGKVERTLVSVGTSGQGSGTVIDGTLYLHTTKGAPKGRIVALIDVVGPEVRQGQLTPRQVVVNLFIASVLVSGGRRPSA
jgi:hypothetical protein